MQALDIHEWDRTPHRTLIVGLLCGPAIVQGDIEGDLQTLERADLVSYEAGVKDAPETLKSVIDQMDPNRPVWMAELTPTGIEMAVRLASSGDILRVLLACSRRLEHGRPWNGATPRSLVNELDRRTGGMGEVDDPLGWLERRRSQLESMHKVPRTIDRKGDGSWQ